MGKTCKSLESQVNGIKPRKVCDIFYANVIN